MEIGGFRGHWSLGETHRPRLSQTAEGLSPEDFDSFMKTFCQSALLQTLPEGITHNA